MENLNCFEGCSIELLHYLQSASEPEYLTLQASKIADGFLVVPNR
jgi:hypothetical protein